jgi:peptide/nickel transport system substrate-binding protein
MSRESRSAPGFARRRFLGTVMGGAALVGASPLLAACGGTTPGAADAAASGPPKRGGTLRVGVAGGGAKDSIDPHTPATNPDIARVINMYEPLAWRDEQYKLVMELAESIEPSKDVRTWTVRLRKGIRFSDGRPVTADDVIGSIKRMVNPKSPGNASAYMAVVDHMTKRDKRTVEFHLKTPNAIFDDYLGQYSDGIVPVDFDVKHPVGTGAFKLDSFTAGQQSTHSRNPYYWREGEPYLDKLVIIDFPDDNARVNAMLSNQVDAIDNVPLPLVKVLKTDPRLRVLTSETGTWLPFTMRVDKPPFDDVRVRQAMRLVVDRDQMVRQVLSGQGRVANDLYGPYDPGFDHNLPQRRQNIAEAKRLLAAAGKSDLSVELVTSPIQAGIVEAATVFAKQAAEAGINVKIRKVDTSTFFGDDYLSWDFAQDFWYTRNYLPQVSTGSIKGGAYNETHWPSKQDEQRFMSLFNEAISTIDESKRNDLIKQLQKIEYDDGGYIIWGYPNQVDAYTRYVGGLLPDRQGIPLNSYRFRKAWLA